MKEQELFKFLQTFGDGRPHQWFEVIHIGVIYMRTTQFKFEALLKKFLSYNLVYRLYKKPNWKDDYYAITKRGDDFLRNHQLKLQNYQDYKYMKEFERTPESAEKITPIISRIQERARLKRRRK